MARRRRQRQRIPTPNSTALMVVRALLARETTVHLLQVGANFGDFNTSLLNRGDGARHALHLMFKSAHTRAWLLEPVGFVFEQLQQNTLQFFGVHSEAVVTPLNVVLCAEDRLDAELYIVPGSTFEAVRKHYGYVPYWVRTELNSMDRKSVERGLAAVLPSDANVPAMVQTVRVRCMAPATLLSSAAHIAPHELDVVVIDAEGLDAKLIRSMFAVSGMRPSVIIFEAHIARNYHQADLRRLLLVLADRGYRLDCCKCRRNAEA